MNDWWLFSGDLEKERFILFSILFYLLYKFQHFLYIYFSYNKSRDPYEIVTPSLGELGNTTLNLFQVYIILCGLWSGVETNKMHLFTKEEFDL